MSCIGRCGHWIIEGVNLITWLKVVLGSLNSSSKGESAGVATENQRRWLLQENFEGASC